MVPVAEEDLDLCAEPEVLDVARDAVPLDHALVQALLDEREVAEVHPVHEQVEATRIGDGEEEDGVVGGAGHQAR